MYSDVDLTAEELCARVEDAVHVSLKAPRGGTIKADGMVGPMNRERRFETPVQLDLKNDAVEIAGLAPTSGMSGLLDMDCEVLSPTDVGQLEGNGQIKNLKATADAVPAKDPMGFSYNTKYNLASHEGTLIVEYYREEETAKLSGSYQMREAMAVHMNLSGQGMSVDELESLLPAFGVTLPSGSVAAWRHAQRESQSARAHLDALVMSPVPVSLNNTKAGGIRLGLEDVGHGTTGGHQDGLRYDDSDLQLKRECHAGGDPRR